MWLPLTWPLTGDLAHNPGLCPDWESNWWPFGSQPVLNPLSHTSQAISSVSYKDTCHWIEGYPTLG